MYLNLVVGCTTAVNEHITLHECQLCRRPLRQITADSLQPTFIPIGTDLNVALLIQVSRPFRYLRDKTVAAVIVSVAPTSFCSCFFGRMDTTT